MPVITVTPENALVDERVCIKISGLPGEANITVKASLFDNKNKFFSLGHFISDRNGEVDLSNDECLGGTYTGVDGMGLFWSMTSDPEHQVARFRQKDVTTPFVVHFHVLKDHLTLDEMKDEESDEVLASAKVYRWYKASHVTRKFVRVGKIRGAIFIPSGIGPFPGIIDLYGVTGGLNEYRASLLASHGFVVLALAYTLYDDLPKEHEDISLKYFMDSIEWLTLQPSVKPGGIGILGVSRGAEIGMILATICPQVKAVLSINGPPFLILHMQDNKAYNIPCVDIDASLVNFTKEGADFSNIYVAKDTDVVRVWNSQASFLNLIGLDDLSLSPKYNHQLRRLLSTKKVQNVEFVEYPGAGHLIEPPYSPFCRASWIKTSGQEYCTLWGGNAMQHNAAQEDAWKRIQQFFREKLCNDSSSLATITQSKL